MLRQVWVVVVTLFNFKEPFCVYESEEHNEYPHVHHIENACVEARTKYGKYRAVAKVEERYLYRDRSGE
jgi:hypothetical protein